MDYLAHISEDHFRRQTVREHLEGTAQLAKKFADAFGYGEWGYCCGLLHDIGKYSDAFQKRILGDAQKVDHATAGAQLCTEKSGYYHMLAYCIAGHHAGLPNTGSKNDRGSFFGRMKKAIADYQAYQAEIQIPALTKPLFSVPRNQNAAFTDGFFIRMLYSCLVDADFLDTEAFMKEGNPGRESGEGMKVLWERLSAHVSGWMERKEPDTVNGRRTEILRHCIEQGQRPKGLFRLTVPTGGGKTVSSLAFSLRHALEHGMSRVIYVIPYTSIIEQNARVFSEILGRDQVLEHHSSVEFQSGEELNPQQLAAENWDKPVIVTTNVQFFESLFANRSTKCRKLHNIANSVIVFDEAQMLPNNYLKPCVAAIQELISHYRCSAVLCTATQPALQNLFPVDMPHVELCPRMEEQFRFFKRTQFVNLGTLSEEDLARRLSGERQALCVLNTKRSVQLLYEKLEGEGVYHLSTLMVPVHRKEVLEEIRARLSAGEKCILVATSLVEAGVDLDFQSVYRQQAGVDSMIQAAGRCNREGRRAPEESPTYLFQLADAQKTPGQEQQIDVGQLILRNYEDISDLKAVREYFTRLYGFCGEGLDRKRILERFQKNNFPFAEVGKEFSLIEEETRSIFVVWNGRAREIMEELQQKGATRALLREAGQYCVQVRKASFTKIYGAGMLKVLSEDWKDDMFLLRDENDYSDKKGLKIDPDLGIGIFVI